MTGRRRFTAEISATSTFPEGPCAAHDRHAPMDAKTCPALTLVPYLVGTLLARFQSREKE